MGIYFFKKSFPLMALLAGSITFGSVLAAYGQEARSTETQLPIPRFVSLKSSKVNVRVGPGQNYSIVWAYQRQSMPVEVVQEYDNWRKVRDVDGDEGWILQSLLSGKRTMIVAPWLKGKKATLELRRKPNNAASVVAFVEPGVIGAIRKCDGIWCELDLGGKRGYMEQNNVWGAYPGEKFSQ